LGKENDTPPSSLMDSTVSPKVKTTEEEGIRGRSLARNTSKVKGHPRTPGSGLRRLSSKSITHTTFPLIVYFVHGHGTSTQMSFCTRTKILTTRTLVTLGFITLCEDLRLRWGLNQSCSPHWELSNDMWHATCTQGNQCDAWLLMVGIQIVNLTPSPSFGHNLCFECPNGSCKFILDIYFPRVFQWYKKLFDPMGFDP
jgi:hypothetical protein